MSKRRDKIRASKSVQKCCCTSFQSHGKNRMPDGSKFIKRPNLISSIIAARPAGNAQKSRTALMIQSTELKRARNDMM